jgi:hypothetical protein
MHFVVVHHGQASEAAIAVGSSEVVVLFEKVENLYHLVCHVCLHVLVVHDVEGNVTFCGVLGEPHVHGEPSLENTVSDCRASLTKANLEMLHLESFPLWLVENAHVNAACVGVQDLALVVGDGSVVWISNDVDDSVRVLHVVLPVVFDNACSSARGLVLEKKN